MSPRRPHTPRTRTVPDPPSRPSHPVPHRTPAVPVSVGRVDPSPLGSLPPSRLGVEILYPCRESRSRVGRGRVLFVTRTLTLRPSGSRPLRAPEGLHWIPTRRESGRASRDQDDSVGGPSSIPWRSENSPDCNDNPLHGRVLLESPTAPVDRIVGRAEASKETVTHLHITGGRRSPKCRGVGTTRDDSGSTQAGGPMGSLPLRSVPPTTRPTCHHYHLSR